MSGKQREGLQRRIQVDLLGFKNILQRTGLGVVHREIAGQFGDPLPDLALIRSETGVGSQTGRNGLRLAGAQAGVHHMARVAELVRDVGPAPLLRAADRHIHLLAGRYQDAGVEHPVLFGAADLLAVQQKHRQGRLVDDAQFRHGGADADLRDGQQTLLQSLAQRQIVRRMMERREQGEHRDMLSLLGIRQTQPGQQFR